MLSREEGYQPVELGGGEQPAILRLAPKACDATQSSFHEGLCAGPCVMGQPHLALACMWSGDKESGSVSCVSMLPLPAGTVQLWGR